MSWRAYVDESEPDRQFDPNTYILAAALLDEEYEADTRQAMLELRRRGQKKLRWSQEREKTRLAILETIASLPALHLVVVRNGRPQEESERCRRKCFDQLAYELDCRGIGQIIAEGRERKANAREIIYFNQLRTAHRIRTDMRLEHVRGEDDPLLWIPDVVAGAVGASRTGSTEFQSRIIDLLEVVSIDAKP